MGDATDIEKKNLEAHVELCAERYNQLEARFEHVENKIGNLDALLREVHDMIQRMSEKRTDQLIGWGVGIIGALLATTVYLITQYVFK
jgi:chaperonin cofactor prefoldin